MTFSQWVRLAVPAVLAVAIAPLSTLVPAPARAAGAWTTLIRPYTYYDLLAEGDTVWCATGEAGLLRYDARDQSFVAINREPGGLSSNHLSRMMRDRAGRLWVGTLGAGASRLSPDGGRWDLVNRFDGLPSDSVTSFAARGDTVLIGTTRGIALWNGTEVTGSLPDGFNPSPFNSDWITGIVIHGDSVWVSTQAGVYRSTFTLLDYDPNVAWSQETAFLPVTAFQNIAANDTTILALQGTTVFRHAFDTPGFWAFARDIEGGGITPNAVRIYEDHGRVLLTTDQGLFVWVSATNRWVRVTDQFGSDRQNDQRSFAITMNRDGLPYAADRDGLRERVSDPALDQWATRVPPGPPGNNILNLGVESQRVYVNTFDEGIGRFDGAEWRIWPPVDCVGCDTTFFHPRYAFALLVDRERRKWFGCWDLAIDVLVDPPGETPQVVHHRYQPPLVNFPRYTCAWASAADSAGGRWFGMDTNNSDFTPRGLTHYDSSGIYVAGFTPDSSIVRGAKIHALTVDRAGRLWVGYTGQGIDIFPINIRPRNRPDSLPPPVTIAESERYDVQGLAAHGDTVWALTTSELIAYKQSNATRIASYSIPAAPGGLSSVNPLAVEPDGTVWVGTVNGIRVVSPGGDVQDFDTSNSPLADPEVRAIRVDPVTGVVWIGTSRGLHRYDPGYRPPPPPAVPELKVTVYPNPAWLSSVGIGIRIDGNSTSYRGEVYDLNGRRLNRFFGVGNQGMVWDGHTEQGDLVRPGIYFLRVVSAGKSATTRVVLLR